MGAVDDMIGKAKQVVGDATGDQKMEAEGRAAQLGEDVKDKIDDVKDAAGEKVNDVLAGAQEKMDEDKEKQQ